MMEKVSINKENIANVIPLEKSRDYTEKSIFKSYLSTGEDAVKDKYIRVYGISKRQKQFNDISKIYKCEVCIPKLIV